MYGVFCLVLPALTLQVMANAVGMSEELCVGIESHWIHISGAEADFTALWTLWEKPVGTERKKNIYIYITGSSVKCEGTRLKTQ